MDNSATAHTCDDKNLFKNMKFHEENEGPLIVTILPKGHVKDAGNVLMTWDDDEVNNHTQILTNACCMPDSPFNLFSSTEFGKFIGTNDHEDTLDDTPI